MKKTAAAALGLSAAAILLAGCGSADNDRSTGNGKGADFHVDATKVTIWHNADDVGNLRFASTLSGTDSTPKSPALLRIPEQDGLCAG
jgi:ABC-type glycerol-3-phosphate transport system substrate-binding protein